MSDPYLGEIRMFAGNFAPRGWATCDGQLQSISQATALFSLLGTQYGGNGTTNFALPDLRGRNPNGQFQGPGLDYYSIGQQGGSENVTLLTTQMPAHNHTLRAAITPATSATPSGSVWAVSGSRRAAINLYTATAASTANMSPQALAVAGSSTAHNNRHPYRALTFIIATAGIYPSRN